MDYAALQAKVATWTVRDDLTGLIPDFIANAEARFNRSLRVPEMEAVDSGTVSSGTVTLPSDFLEMRSVYVNASPVVVLEQMSLPELKSYYACVSSGSPANFALQAGNQLVLAPAPADDTVLILNYYAQIPSLSDSVTSNWLIASHPDVYLAASLFEAFVYTRDTEAMQMWESRTAAILAEIERHGHKKAIGGPLRMRGNTFA